MKMKSLFHKLHQSLRINCSSLTLQLSLQVDALVAAVAQLQANVREIQRTTTTANTAADEFDAVIILQTHDT